MSKDGLPEDMNKDDINYFKYVLITSVEIKRGFSVLKTQQSPICFI